MDGLVTCRDYFSIGGWIDHVLAIRSLYNLWLLLQGVVVMLFFTNFPKVQIV